MINEEFSFKGLLSNGEFSFKGLLSNGEFSFKGLLSAIMGSLILYTFL